MKRKIRFDRPFLRPHMKIIGDSLAIVVRSGYYMMNREEKEALDRMIVYRSEDWGILTDFIELYVRDCMKKGLVP